MLDKIILGFLLLKPLTTYDLKKALENSVNHFYSTSYGSIHPAMIKMEKKGWVTGKDVSTGSRKKILYTITAEGTKAFNQWMGTEIPVTRIKEDALVRMFFFGLIPKEQRIQLINDYILKIKETICLLSKIREMAGQKVIPEKFKEIAEYQLETVNFGIDSGEFSRQWFEDFIEKERIL